MSTRVAIAGDWHGNTNWATGRLTSLAAQHPGVDTLLHLGDFGIWPGDSGAKYLSAVEKVAARAQVRILVTLGNHEAWGRLDALWAEPENYDEDGNRLPLALTKHIRVLPRGHRFELGGRSFVSLGGAPSVDFDLRVEGQSWWPEEAITPDDVAVTVAGGYADIMLAHDSPERPWMTSKVEHICHGEPDPDEIAFSWSDRALAYAAVGRERMTEAFLGVSPRIFFHGHYHVRSSDWVTLPNGRECLIQALAADGAKGNVVLLDLDTLTVEECG